MVLSKIRKDTLSSDPFADRFVYEEVPASKKRAKARPYAEPLQSSRGPANASRGTSQTSQSTSVIVRVAQLLGLVAIVTWLAIASLSNSREWEINSAEHEAADQAVSPHREPAAQSSSLPAALEHYVQQLVSSALRDPVGRRDFALVQDGAVVIPKLTVPAPPSRASKQNKLIVDVQENGPEAALRDDLRIGQCWLWNGNTGQLGVGLQTFISPTHVTIDHIPLEIASDIGQAPRKMNLWGLVEGHRNLAIHRSLTERGKLLPTDAGHQGPVLRDHSPYILLATFDYNIFAPFHIQTFPITATAVEEGIYFGVVVLEILDNWGAESTCLYRMRIHGNIVVL